MIRSILHASTAFSRKHQSRDIFSRREGNLVENIESMLIRDAKFLLGLKYLKKFKNNLVKNKQTSKRPTIAKFVK